MSDIEASVKARVEIQMAIITEVLADPIRTARVVAAALIAQDQLVETQYRDHPAFATLVDAFTEEKSA